MPNIYSGLVTFMLMVYFFKLNYYIVVQCIWQYMSTIVYSDIYFLFLVPALFVGKFKTEKIHNNF